MRILYHHRTRAEDGQAVHIRALQRAFEEEGHRVYEVSLVARREDSNGSGDGDADSSRWAWVSRLPRFALELAEYAYTATARSRLVGAAARFEPDFLYERYAFGNAAGVLAARRSGLPLVLEVNSPMVHELARTRGLSFPGIAERMERFVFGSADLVCAVTGVLRDMLVELGVERERCLVTPNGVHLELYEVPDRERARADALADLGWASEERGGPPALALGFVGYSRPWHRLDLVIDALARPELEGAHLFLVGEGPAHAELRERAERLGLAERVHFAGPRAHDRVPALLPAFDVALVPAINPYASPLKLIEYMAAGRAILAPDQANLREVLTDGKSALLFPADDGEALFGALARLAGDVELRGRLGAAARRTVEERDLTWRGNARRVVEAVERLRGGAREAVA